MGLKLEYELRKIYIIDLFISKLEIENNTKLNKLINKINILK